ncbi:hypothetical protein HPB50_000920 [Hyalomma asiaticum]|uniref:Uncharacterized protein n=1 Tax=Hyalomma asiaticum TaxID=266040 RepID=A0ACB7S9K5_HYAAI|nr:hypothetical protein HPB50_000920 [Hyalomma asiaticum]
MRLRRATEKAVAAGVRMLKRVHSHMKARKPAFLEVGGLSQRSEATRVSRLSSLAKTDLSRARTFTVTTYTVAAPLRASTGRRHFLAAGRPTDLPRLSSLLRPAVNGVRARITRVRRPPLKKGGPPPSLEGAGGNGDCLGVGIEVWTRRARQRKVPNLCPEALLAS